jgi:hypothetical protein
MRALNADDTTIGEPRTSIDAAVTERTEAHRAPADAVMCCVSENLK